MANSLANLMQRRSFGFAGQEGEMFDEQNQTQPQGPVITNNSLAAMMQPQNYIQRTGGERVDMGRSGRDIRVQGLPAILHPDNDNITVYATSGKQYQTTASEQRALEDQNRQRAETADLPRRMALAKVQEQEAKLTGGGLSPADQLARDRFEWEKGGGKATATAKQMTADQEARYRQKFGDAYGTTMSALQSSNDVVKAALGLKEDPGLEGISGMSGYFPNIPGFAAAAAQQKFETLQGKITKMAKDAAASSGSIGPMAVQEWKILRDQVSAIDPTKLNVKQLESVLDDLVIQSQNAARITEEAYNSTFEPDFDKYPQFSNPRGAIQQGFQPTGYTQTATNPRTGERIGLRNGQWEPIR